MSQSIPENDAIPSRVQVARDVLLSLEASKTQEYKELKEDAAKVLSDYLNSK
jgi:hypothetical protein